VLLSSDVSKLRQQIDSLRRDFGAPKPQATQRPSFAELLGDAFGTRQASG
jgi:hypothetical protein